MKRITLLLLMVLCLFIPSTITKAQEFELKQGKEIKAGYAGEDEAAYNYFKVSANKNAYIDIKVKTSNKKNLVFDICDESKQVIASNINVEHGKKVLHKVKKGCKYYIRTKGELNQTHSIMYKTTSLETLSYADKYSYVFTNASMNSKKNGVKLEIKTREAGILSFMGNTSNKVNIKFYNKKNKPLTQESIIKGNGLTGLAVNRNDTYYVNIWNTAGTNEGTTELKNIKYQIRHVSTSKYASRGSSKELSRGKSSEAMIIAGKNTTNWYEVELTNDQKIQISFESRLFQNNGIKMYICNKDGKVLHKNPISITEKLKVKYKKKYKMVYPIKNITTGKLPKGTYYIKVVSNNKKTTGSYAISWK